MCSIVGYLNANPHGPPPDLEPLKALLNKSKIRGLHAFGMTCKTGTLLSSSWHYDMEELIFNIPPNLVAGIFHCRYSTSGDYKDHVNNQPIHERVEGVTKSLVFNGVVSMKTKAEMEAEYGIEMTTENDGEIVLRKHTGSRYDFERFLRNHPGSFAGAVMTHDSIMFGRNARRPLWYGHTAGASYFASTEDIFHRAGIGLTGGKLDKVSAIRPLDVLIWDIS